MQKKFLLTIIFLTCLVMIFTIGCKETECTHDWGEGTVSLNAKCDLDGVITYTCLNCGDTKDEPITERPAHVWNDGVETKPATETEKGIITFTCMGCGETKTEDIPKLIPSHTHSYSLTWANDENYHWKECSCGDKKNYELHNESGWITDNDSTCTEYGEKHTECIVCGEKISIDKIEPKDHDWKTSYQKDDKSHWYECKDCDAITTKIVHEYKNGICKCGQEEIVYIRNNNKILFGSYPQSKVDDNVLISILNSSAGDLPTSENARNWTSYGYYKKGQKSNFMWYTDVTYDGEKYRGVYFIDYRQYYQNLNSNINHSYQQDNGYETNNVYWFKFEWISWTILDKSKGLLLCDMIIDSQEYYLDKNNRTKSGKTIYPNNYEYSTIRAWLNENFYNTAFTQAQKDLIKNTTVDNSARSSNPNNNATYWNKGANIYACSNTQDKIYLLSVQEATNSAYGLSSKWDEKDVSRQKNATDYAQSQGCMIKSVKNPKGYWLLRSTAYDNSAEVRRVSSDGYVDTYEATVNYTNFGIIPALQIQL